MARGYHAVPRAWNELFEELEIGYYCRTECAPRATRKGMAERWVPLWAFVAASIFPAELRRQSVVYMLEHFEQRAELEAMARLGATNDQLWQWLNLRILGTKSG